MISRVSDESGSERWRRPLVLALQAHQRTSNGIFSGKRLAAVARTAYEWSPDDDLIDDNLRRLTSRPSTRASSSRSIVGAEVRFSTHQRCVFAAWRRARGIQRISSSFERSTTAPLTIRYFCLAVRAM
jgi:hypothetical protein